MNWNVVFGLGVLFCFFCLPIILWIWFTKKKNRQYLVALNQITTKFNLTLDERQEAYEWTHFRGLVNGFETRIGSYSDSKVLKGSGGICNKVSVQVMRKDEDDFEFSIVKRNIFQSVGESLDDSCIEIHNFLLKNDFIFRSNDADQLESLLSAKSSQLIIDLWSNGNHLYYYLSYKNSILEFSNTTNFRPLFSVKKFTTAIQLLSEFAIKINKQS